MTAINNVQPLRIIFAGTPEFAAIHLQGLLSTPHEICAVYTQPDRPAGRGRKLSPSPVKQLALEHSLEVRQPKNLNTAEEFNQLKALNADLMVVVAYGIILKKNILDAPKLGCINVHASLLPRWRGAAPIQRAIAAGDQETGVAIMQMALALDAGPVLNVGRCPINLEDTAATIHDRLATLGAQLLPQSINEYQTGKVSGTPQDEDAVTYAHKLDKKEALLDWNQTAIQLAQIIRAFNPWPIAFTHHNERVIRIHAAQTLDSESTLKKPGTIIALSKSGIDVAAGNGSVLRLQTLQLAGRKPLQAAAFLNGLDIKIGDGFTQIKEPHVSSI